MMLLTLGACSPTDREVPGEAAAGPPVEAGSAAEPVQEKTSAATESSLDETSAQPGSSRFLAAGLVRMEWSKAENRAICAPIAFSSDAGAPATARRAEFSGGWAVAFDTPDQRSAYGLAGPGTIPEDGDEPAEQAARLGAQWPQFTTLAELPAPAFAGYGIKGALEYPEDSPDGRGLNSLAYLRIGGQQCTYNVWSRLGRAHLEALLDSLRMLD